MTDTLLNIEGLKTHFFTEAGVVQAVDGITFKIKKGETLGLVGESGSGKTVTALSVLGIVPKPGQIVEGKIEFNGEDLLTKTDKEMQKLRGGEFSIIFQDPSSSLNPVFNVETQIRDVIMEHQNVTKEEAIKKVIELLDMVGIPEGEARMHEYPHQFSGGMKQRVAIARALACTPTLLFADESTTNLDVTIQAQVLTLLNNMKKNFGMSLVMITHDMGVIAEMTSRIVVIYAGRVCEIATTYEIFENPKHPYTEALLAAVPRLDMRKTLRVIPGNIPNLIDPPTGCRFHPRCQYAQQICKKQIPPLESIETERSVACHEWQNIVLKGEN
ncbi:MAG: ABC transporter ATP-binding protein [Candidatus Bathyarchaeota archaeon]|nr:ABC transporter ATP-binding protein [Candidatus Bathyarchaeota archaeon]